MWLPLEFGRAVNLDDAREIVVAEDGNTAVIHMKDGTEIHTTEVGATYCTLATVIMHREWAWPVEEETPDAAESTESPER